MVDTKPISLSNKMDGFNNETEIKINVMTKFDLAKLILKIS